MQQNPLFRDADISFLLREVFHVASLCELERFSHHDLETFELYIESARALARTRLFPLFKEMDANEPTFDGVHVRVHPRMGALYDALAELGVVSAPRPGSVGGADLPQTVVTVANLHLMAANAGAVGFPLLTAGAAHLIEAFGDDDLKATYMQPMYDGRWTGTMALTEPHAGSSLAEITTTATPNSDGTFRVRGAKIFISGGDHDIRENIVHMTLARIAGAPEGIKGVSLFAIPKYRVSPDGLVHNDVHTTQLIHKIGWKALPSVALGFGENDDCHGWLVGAPGHGLKYMFQMMNEARLMVGANGIATASAAYFEALAYADTRRQGRGLAAASTPGAVRLIEHPDVRRMLLRQKAIVEGGLALLIQTGLFADTAAGATGATQIRAAAILDLLTPIAKSFPAEWGFESNSLALQILGGYGYTSEYLPEAWLRDQRLNSIHEGTTGIQGLDLLGRKVVAHNGAALAGLIEELQATTDAAARIDALAPLATKLSSLSALAQETTHTLARRGLGGDIVGMLGHSDDYLRAMSVMTVAWMWLKIAVAAHARPASDFSRGKIAACRYWFAAEVPRATAWFGNATRDDDAFVDLDERCF